MTDIEFADDAVLFALSRQSAQSSLTLFHDIASSFGLSVNFLKTKAMACGIGLTEEDHQPLVVDGKEMEKVPSYVYLRSLTSPCTRVGP